MPSAKGQPKRKGVSHDWELIKRDYCAGHLSLRELEARHHVSRTTLLKHVKDEGWAKSLETPIREATKTILLKHQLQTSDDLKGLPQVLPMTPADSDAELVQVAAMDAAKVILVHRHDARNGRKLAGTMLQELALVTHQPQDILQLALETIEAPDTEGLSDLQAAEANSLYKMAKSRLKDRIDDLLSLPARIAMLDKACSAFERLQRMERQAWNLDVPEEKDKTKKEQITNLTPMAREHRLLEMLGRVRQRQQLALEAPRGAG